jgi:hypothetical protein
MLKEKLNSEVVNGMEIPFQKEIKEGYAVAKKAHIHSEKCRRNRESRHKKFDKVRVLYWNLMFLLGGICVVSVGRLMYEIIRILKMQ